MYDAGPPPVVRGGKGGKHCNLFNAENSRDRKRVLSLFFKSKRGISRCVCCNQVEVTIPIVRRGNTSRLPPLGGKPMPGFCQELRVSSSILRRENGVQDGDFFANIARVIPV